MFRKNLSLQQLFKGAVATFQRFPLTLLFAFAGTAVAITFAELDHNFQNQYQILLKAAWICWIGLILFFDLHLISEKYRLKQAKKWLLLAAGLAFLAVLYLLLPGKIEIRNNIQLFLVGLSLHLAASFAPFLNLKNENGFWQFNEKLFLRFLTAALYSAVLFIGLALAITAVQELFQIRFTFQIYPDLWLFLAGVFNTWFFLAGVPQNFEALETETAYPKGLKVFTQFVLLPLVTIYLLILYGYMGKIIFQWEWPRGWVSNLVLGFSVAGIFSLLLIHPIRNAAENSWIRTYARWFYRALFPLLILFGLAIWRRVSDYGITEERYFVLILAFWLLAVALYFLFSRQKNIKFIPVTLAFLALLTSFGPWGAYSVSQRSQTNRLLYYFGKNGMLFAGKVVPAKKEVPGKEEAEIASIIDYLGDVHHFESLRPLFGIRLDTMLARTDTMLYAYENVTKIVVEDLNLTYRPYFNSGDKHENERFYFTAVEQELQEISGYDFLFPYYLSTHENSSFYEKSFQLRNKEFLIIGKPKALEVIFKYGNDSAVFDLNTTIATLKKTSPKEIEKGVTYNLAVGNTKVKVQLVSITGSFEKKKPVLETFSAKIMVNLPDTLNSVSER